jgi:hypothetical protein
LLFASEIKAILEAQGIQARIKFTLLSPIIWQITERAATKRFSTAFGGFPPDTR